MIIARIGAVSAFNKKPRHARRGFLSVSVFYLSSSYIFRARKSIKMSCLYPVKMYRINVRHPSTGNWICVHDRSQALKSSQSAQVINEFYRPCQYCIECRLKKSRYTAVRCVHQASLSSRNSFLTLTFAPENLPSDMSLSTRTMQLFWKKLRKRLNMPGLKYYAAGEYGEGAGSRDLNPHYHACLFGYDFPDKKFYKKTPSGDPLYLSPLLEKVWPYGYCPIGDVTFESAAYVARYTLKKVYGDAADEHYRRTDENGSDYWLMPEKSWSSNGLGEEWFKNYYSDMYPSEELVIRGGQVCRPPPYYDKLLLKHDPELYAEVEYRRAADKKIIISKNNFTIPYGPDNPTCMNVSEIVRRSQLRAGKLDNERS